MKIVYHQDDLDGLCSAAIIKSRFKSAELIPMSYGDKFPFWRVSMGETVFMVDFSLQPFEEMEILKSMCNLVWIDHHVSAIEESVRRIFRCDGHRYVGLGACILTWRHLNENTECPYGVQMLGLYDVFDRTNPNAIWYNYGLRAMVTSPTDMEWEKVLGNDPAFNIFTVELGKKVYAYQRNVNAQVARNAFEVEFEGYPALAVNHGQPGSLVFETVFDPVRHDFGIVFAKKNSSHWDVRLYDVCGKCPVDLAGLAKEYGGGGHRGAAGFQCAELPF